MSRRRASFVAFLACCIISLSTAADWDYTFIKSTWTSSNEAFFKPDVRVIRIAQGVYALNGTAEFFKPLDNSYMFAGKVYYSSNGNGMWTLTPFEVKPMPFYNIMNTIYKEYLQIDMNRCAGTPLIGDEEYKEPLEAQVFYVNKCMIDPSNFPSHFRPGYYKVNVEANGPDTEILVEIISQVYKK